MHTVKSPCDCEGMEWMMNNNKVFQQLDNHWILTWLELDKTDNGTNIENLGVKFSHCLFCGKQIKG